VRGCAQATAFETELEQLTIAIWPVLRPLHVKTLLSLDLLLSPSDLSSIPSFAKTRMEFKFEQSNLAWDTAVINGETVQRLKRT
jgi:hypothetical protein